MNAKTLMTAVALTLTVACCVHAADPFDAGAIRGYRTAVGGKVPIGPLVVANDYVAGPNGKVTLEVRHSDDPTRDIGHFPLDGGYRGGLSHQGKELGVGLDWGVRVIFGNGVKSDVRMLKDVAAVENGRIVVKATDIQKGTAPIGRPAAVVKPGNPAQDPNRRITSTHRFYFHATGQKTRGKPFTDGWNAPDGFRVVDAKVVEVGTQRKVKRTYLTISPDKTSVSMGGVYDSLWTESTGSLYDGKVRITYERK